MREVTISLSEEQEKFLKLFSSKQYEGSKDNVGTRNPLHLVQTREERVVDPVFDDPDKVKYIVPDECYEEYESLQELIKGHYKYSKCPIEIVSFDEAYEASGEDEFIDVNGEEQVIFDEDDYLAAYGIDKKSYYKVHTCYHYRTVAIFFILDEAKKYMKYQGHNLTNPRTYTVDAGYSNKGEYHHFWQLLFDVGKNLNMEVGVDA